MSQYIPKRGDIIHAFNYTGVMLDVFTSAESGKHLAEVLWAKNIFKGQSAETQTLDALYSGKLRPATLDELQAEIAKRQSSLDQQVRAMFDAAKTPTLEAMSIAK